jgi:predicted PhzF superfamily epimerase YddE/YHI9
MPLLHVLRVFTAANGKHGNPLGVFVEEPSIEGADHQAIATALGFSETVFVENAQAGALRLYTPGGELPFAGHPLVGTASLLSERGFRTQMLRPPAGPVPVWFQRGLVWIRGRVDWCPSWSHVQADTVDEVEGMRRAPEGHDHVQVWAYLDEDAGAVRARTFAPRFGVVEDEACGSASMVLASMLARPLVIRHGNGSEILVRPTSGGEVELGGRTCVVQTREISLTELLRGDPDALSRHGASNALSRPQY